MDCSPRRKNNLFYAYRDWCRWKGKYEFKTFKEGQPKLPYIPTERALDQLIAGFGPKHSAFLQLFKETGLSRAEFDYDEPDVGRTVRRRRCNAPIKLVRAGEEDS